MLNEKGFDLWADGYDRSVAQSDAEESYPFAGYREILNDIYRRVLTAEGRDVLDIGFGTGTLTAKLYEQGCHIWGQDFSARMVELAQEKMPQAALYCGDFSEGLVEQLRGRRYDAIIATYSLHHLTDERKVTFLRSLRSLLREDGCIYVGDVAFETRAEMDACRTQAGDSWDEDEIYFVYDELKEKLPELEFERFSDCAGVLRLRR